MNVISLPFASFGLTATGRRLDEKILSRHYCSGAAMISEQLRMRPFMSMFSAIFLGNKRPDETIWLVSFFLRQLIREQFLCATRPSGKGRYFQKKISALL